MSDIVERLRQAADRADYAADADTESVCDEAAAEIERLRAVLQRIADGALLGTNSAAVARAALAGRDEAMPGPSKGGQ